MTATEEEAEAFVNGDTRGFAMRGGHRSRVVHIMARHQDATGDLLSLPGPGRTSFKRRAGGNRDVVPCSMCKLGWHRGAGGAKASKKVGGGRHAKHRQQWLDVVEEARHAQKEGTNLLATQAQDDEQPTQRWQQWLDVVEEGLAQKEGTNLLVTQQQDDEQRNRAVFEDIANFGLAQQVAKTRRPPPPKSSLVGEHMCSMIAMVAPCPGKQEPSTGNRVVDAASATVMNGQVQAGAKCPEDLAQAAEYVIDIDDNLRRGEETHVQPMRGYLYAQGHDGRMRNIVVDWLVDVHKKYMLSPLTLFLGVGYFDRYLERRQCTRRYLQLAGVTAFLIASKFEDVDPVRIGDMVYITDNAYSKEDVIKMEKNMMAALEFKVNHPTALHFLDRYAATNGCSEVHRELAQYLLELSLVDFRMVSYAPSHMAAAALYLSNRLLRIQVSWPQEVALVSGRSNSPELWVVSRKIYNLFASANHNPLQAVVRKFSLSLSIVRVRSAS